MPVSCFKHSSGKYAVLFLYVLFFISCNDNKENDVKGDLDGQISNKALPVEAQTIKPQAFQKQIIANGLVKASQKTELRFKSGNRIDKILVDNGQRVFKGQSLAVLDNALLANQLQKAKIQLVKAERKLQEVKINFGYGSVKNKDLDPETLRNLQIKSEYLSAENAVENMQILYEQTSIEAPFSGVVANIQAKPGDYITSGEVFCTLINQEGFEVYFSVLENELPFVEIGQKAKIIPYANPEKEYPARVSEINPMVDENGLVKIKAKIKNKDASLLEGMHVKVYVNKPIDKVVVIPKEAVVLRSGREVVFTAENGLAKWNYVDVLYENAISYAIKEGLQVGDTIIVSGNMNLAHDAKVNATLVGENGPSSFSRDQTKNDG